MTLYDLKKNLIEQLINNVVEQGYIDAEFKNLYYTDFLPATHKNFFKHAISAINEGKPISWQFVEEKFEFYPTPTDKTQFEIIIQLKEIYYQEMINSTMADYSDEMSSGHFEGAFAKVFDKLYKLRNNMERTRTLDTHDDETMMGILDDITDETGVVQFGMKGIDDLKMEKGQLVGILAPTGSGKSILLQKLNALAMQRGYKTAHATIELSDKLFMKRLITALQMMPYSQLSLLGDKQKRQLVSAFKSYPKVHISTVRHGAVNLAKIEKVIQQKRPDVVFVDYAQILNESLDPKDCKIAVRLHEMAIKYDCLILVGLQTNQDGRDRDEPPHLGDIKLVKALADDMDLVLALHGRKHPADSRKMWFTLVDRKQRNDVKLEAKYLANLDTGHWETRLLNLNGKPVVEGNVDDEVKK